MSVTTNYVENLDHATLMGKIHALPNPQIVVWYFGPYGLKPETVGYYQSKLSGFVEAGNNAQVYLFDLTAWKTFTSSKTKLSDTSPFARKINSEQIARIKCIMSAEILQKMQQVEGEALKELKDRIVKRDFVRNASQSFPNNGRTLRDVFENNCPIFEEFYEWDSAKCYSIVQYVEAYFIVEKIVEEQSCTQGDINVVFALPNDEAKYYRDDNNSFAKDVEMLLKIRLGNTIADRKINIHFYNFTFGDGSAHARPYLSPSPSLKRLHLEKIYTIDE